jgi:hypothetical protein
MFATFPTCFLLKWRRWLVRILNIGPRGAERATCQATIGNDLQMCRYTRSRARLAPVPFPGILWSAMVFPAVIQLVTSSSHPRSRNRMHLVTGAVHQGLSPFLDRAAGAPLEEPGGVVLVRRCQSLRQLPSSWTGQEL